MTAFRASSGTVARRSGLISEAVILVICGPGCGQMGQMGQMSRMVDQKTKSPGNYFAMKEIR
jgi:hypothetical protein